MVVYVSRAWSIWAGWACLKTSQRGRTSPPRSTTREPCVKPRRSASTFGKSSSKWGTFTGKKIQGKQTAPATINACFVRLCSSLEVSEEVRQYLKTPTFDNWRVYHKRPFPQCSELWELSGCAPNENDRCVSRRTSLLADALVSMRIGAQESKDRLHDRLHQRGVWSGGASLCSVKRFNRCGKRNNQSQLQEGFTSCGWRRLFNIFLLSKSYKTRMHICRFSFPKWDSGLLLNFFPNFNLLMFHWFLQRKT